MDEGFEDGRSGDFPKSPPLSQVSDSSKLIKPSKGKKVSWILLLVFECFF